MTKFKVESGIDIPEKRIDKIPTRDTYPFAEMKVGQSFLVKASTGELKRKVGARLSTAIANYRTRTGSPASFLVRTMEDGIRCWRIEDGSYKPRSKRTMADVASNISSLHRAPNQ